MANESAPSYTQAAERAAKLEEERAERLRLEAAARAAQADKDAAWQELLAVKAQLGEQVARTEKETAALLATHAELELEHDRLDRAHALVLYKSLETVGLQHELGYEHTRARLLKKGWSVRERHLEAAEGKAEQV